MIIMVITRDCKTVSIESRLAHFKRLFYFCAMSKANNRFIERNIAVRSFFSQLENKNPNWRIEALERVTADKFFISERTVRAIVKQEGIYIELKSV